jgi:outer membrane protein assembly factor BamB
MSDKGGDGRTRRRYLRAVALSGAAALAGCPTPGDGTDGDGEESPTATATPDPATKTASATPTATATRSPTPTATATPRPQAAVTGTYPGYRGGAERRAFAPDAGTPGAPAVAAELDLPTAVYQPVLDGRRLYLARRTHTGSAPTVAALDLGQGERLWARDLGARATGAPSVTGEHVFVGTRNGTHALDQTGELVWETETGAATDRVPAVTDERVFVAGDGTLAAYAHDGTETWAIPLGTRPLAAPAAADGRVYVVLPRDGDDPDLVAFDGASGSSRWRRAVEIDAGYPPSSPATPSTRPAASSRAA